MKILMTGATGFIGKKLGQALFHNDHEIVALSRSKKETLNGLPFPAEIFEWDPIKNKIPIEAFEGVEIVIHFAPKSACSFPCIEGVGI